MSGCFEAYRYEDSMMMRIQCVTALKLIIMRIQCVTAYILLEGM
jgi:hypothetical protein